MILLVHARRFGRIARAVTAWHSRLLLHLLLAVLALLMVLGLIWQFYLLPRLDQFRPIIVKAIAQESGSDLSVQHLSGGWAGIFPRLRIDGVTVRDAQQRVVVELASIDAELSWSSILVLAPHFHRLTLTAPRLSIVHDMQGIWYLGGFTVREGRGDDNRFIDWLLSQGELSLTGGEVIWHDMRSSQGPQMLSGVRMNMSKWFSRHRFSLSITPPAALALPLMIDGNWYGSKVSDWRDWHGVVNVKMNRFDLARLASWLPIALRGPMAWQGQGGGEFSLAFADGKAERIQLLLSGKNWQGDFQGHAIRLAQVVDARVNWRRQGRTQFLALQAARIDTAAGMLCRDCGLKLKQVAADSPAQSWTLDAHDWQLTPLITFMPLLPQPWQARFTGLSLGGELKQLRLHRQGLSYDGEARVQAASMAGYPGWPAVAGVDVQLRFDTHGGQLQLSSKQFRFSAPEWFSEDLQFKSFKLDADWQRDKQDWRVRVKRLQLQNDDIAASLVAGYTSRAHGRLDLTGDISHLRASRVTAYLPRQVGTDTLVWLKQALIAGEAYDGKVVLNGDLAQFPFTDDRGGIFRITARARDTVLKYADGWPAIEGIAGELDFRGTRMEIHGREARLAGARLSAVSAVIPDLNTSTPLLQIDGQARGPTREFLNFLRTSPIHARTDDYLGQLDAAGNGDLLLKLDLPLANFDAAKIAGQYRLIDNQLDFGGIVPRFAKANGRVAFTEKQIQISDMNAQALGGPLQLVGGTDAAGVLKVQINGQAQLAEVAKRFDLPLAGRAHGTMAYQGVLTGNADGAALSLQSSLAGAQIDLPMPLGKLASENRPLWLKVDGGHDKPARIEFSYDKVLQGLIVRDAASTAAQIGLNRTPTVPTQAGISLVGGWRELNLDGWRELADEIKGDGDSLPITSIDLTFGHLSGWGYALNDLAMKLHREGETWQGELASREVAGKLAWHGQGRGKFSTTLSHLTLPLPESGNAQSAIGPAAGNNRVKSSLPLPAAIDLQVEDFRYQALQLGRLDAEAVQQGDLWRFNAVSLVNPDGKLTMSGLWRPRSGRSRMEAKVDVATESLGKLLGRFGYPDTIKRAPAQFSGDLAWEGNPLAPDWSTLAGSMKLDVQAGQFSKIAPGAGRFLSILSLQSLTRRVQLDFRDVFSEGFEFDSVTGEATIQRGQARTENLIISGPAAQVLFRGDADFVAGTQNLRVRIVPAVGDTVAVATTLINPIAGAVAFLLQRILKDPLGQLVAYEYDIKGTMRDPQIQPIKRTSANRTHEARPR